MISDEISEVIDQAVGILRGGGVVIFPTDTVMGVGVDALNAAAVSRLFEIKKREPNNPLPVLLPDESALDTFAIKVNIVARNLASNFWPGGLTLVLKADLKRTGVVHQDASGRFADFHALRHTFISALARTGAHPKVAQTLARHKTLDMTLSRYTHVLGGDLVTALANLPAPPSPNAQTTTAALAATGTDGDPKIACTLFAPDGDFDCHSVASDGTIDQLADPIEKDHKSLETASLGTDRHPMTQMPPRDRTGNLLIKSR